MVKFFLRSLAIFLAFFLALGAFRVARLPGGAAVGGIVGSNKRIGNIGVNP